MQPKQGISYVLIGLVTGVAVLAVMLTVTTAFGEEAERYVDNTICRITVTFESIPYLGTFYDGVNCKVNERTADQQELYAIITEELTSCWSKTGAHDGNLISAYSTDLLTTDTACLICAQIEPEDEDGQLILEPQQLKNYLNTIETNGKKGILAQLIDTEDTLDYDYAERQTVTRAQPVTIAYFIYKSNIDTLTTNPTHNQRIITEDIASHVLSGGAGARAAVPANRLVKSKLVAKGIGKRTIAIAGLGTIGVVLGVAEGVNFWVYKENTYQGLVIGTGTDIAEQCDYLIR